MHEDISGGTRETRSPATGEPMRVGRDLLPAGRLIRVVAGILFLAAAVATAASLRHVSLPAVLEIALTVLIAATGYTVLVWLLGERLLDRIDPWLAAIVIVLPLALVGALPFVPKPVGVGADLYVAVSLLVQAAIGYGGCEIAGVPTLVLRRRHTVYCALNGVDVVERWLRDRSRSLAWGLAVLAFVVIFALIVLAEGLGSGVGYWAAYMLFLVVGFIANRIVAARHRGADGQPPSSTAAARP